MQPVWEVFTRLHNARQSGFGHSPLALGDITAMLDMLGVSNDVPLAEEYLQLITELDREYLTWANEQDENNKRKRRAERDGEKK